MNLADYLPVAVLLMLAIGLGAGGFVVFDMAANGSVEKTPTPTATPTEEPTTCPHCNFTRGDYLPEIRNLFVRREACGWFE